MIVLLIPYENNLVINSIYSDKLVVSKLKLTRFTSSQRIKDKKNVDESNAKKLALQYFSKLLKIIFKSHNASITYKKKGK